MRAFPPLLLAALLVAGAPGAAAPLPTASRWWRRAPSPIRTPAAAAAVAAASGSAGNHTGVPVSVSVPGRGRLTGFVDDGVRHFLGVPYARAPVGRLRWRAPEPHPPWGSRPASQFGHACHGAYDLSNVTAIPGYPQWTFNATLSEDCLFLNVYAPDEPPPEPLPVMVWFHGGGYTGGASNSYSGKGLVRGSHSGVVVVTVNYRLGVFGFLGGAALRARSPDGSMGNYGIEDQRAAVRWVRAHAGAFGGDTRRVTLFGQSAGANSVLQHMTQPASFGIYDRAVVESGTYLAAHPLAHAERKYAKVLRTTGCESLRCLAELSADVLEAAANYISANQTAWCTCLMCGPSCGDGSARDDWGPVIDGVALTEDPLRAISAGRYNRGVPVLIGSQRDEGSYFYNGTGYNMSMTELNFDFTEGLKVPPEKLRRLKELYDESRYDYPADRGFYSEWWWKAVRVSTDHSLGHCPMRRAARGFAAGGTRTFAYMFEHPGQYPDGTPCFGPGNTCVPHAGEITFVFGCGVPSNSSVWPHDPARPDGRGCEAADEIALSAAVVAYWTRFAASGDPNVATLPHWPSYRAAEDTVLRIDTGAGGIRPGRHIRREACDFWDEHDNFDSRDEMLPNAW